jgi:mRNA-degrading endonuclease RelE of RelBE toxin-antitoxin system
VLADVKYTVIVRPPAKAEIDALRVFDQRKITDTIRRNLIIDPKTETRNKKLLRGLTPAFEREPPVYELKVGEYRVLYDVNDQKLAVFVRAVRKKSGGMTTEEITR